MGGRIIDPEVFEWSDGGISGDNEWSGVAGCGGGRGNNRGWPEENVKGDVDESLSRC